MSHWPGAAFPDEPAGISVLGGVSDAGQAAAIQDSLHRIPERFGIDRTGLPSINVEPLLVDEPPQGQVCFEGVVYQGGPRSKVVLGLRALDDDWQVESVRIVEQALQPPQAPAAGQC